MKLWNGIKERHRLWRIERALGVRLTKEQRQTVLCSDYPMITGGRRSGKTLTACMWVLLHRKKPLNIRNELAAYSRKQMYGQIYGQYFRPFAVPDPDVESLQMASMCLKDLVDKQKKLKEKKIPVFDIEDR